MIGLVESDAHLLGEPEQRPNKQGNAHDKEGCGAVEVLQFEIGAAKTDDQQQADAHPAQDSEMCRIAQKLCPSAQPRDVRFEVGPAGIVLGNVVQAADAVDDSGQPPEQDRDETGNGAQNKGWRHGLGHHSRELGRIGQEHLWFSGVGSRGVRDCRSYVQPGGQIRAF